MIRHLTYSVLNNITRINRLVPFIGSISQRISHQTSILYPFQFINQFQNSSRQVNTVCNNFYRHSICQIYTLYRTFIFIFATFMKTGHRIIEMSSMRESYRIRRLNLIIFSLRMSNGCHNSLGTSVFCKIMCPMQFGTDIPALDTGSMFQQRHIFIFIGSFQKTVILASCHLRIQIRPFDMQTENRRLRFLHQLLTNIDRLIYPLKRSR